MSDMLRDPNGAEIFLIIMVGSLIGTVLGIGLITIWEKLVG